MKEIKILGTGCPKCNKLAALVDQTAREMKIEYRLEKVTDLNKISEYGVLFTPGLVVDGEVKAAGKVPRVKDIQKMLS